MMKAIFRGFLVFLGVMLIPAAFAESSCNARDVVVVELDFVKGKEVMKIDGVVPKPGAAFEEFFKRCARKTVILASPDAKVSQIMNVRFFMGKIGVVVDKKNFFIFAARPGGRTMTYMETFATIKYTKDKAELLKITENPPMESNFL